MGIIAVLCVVRNQLSVTDVPAATLSSSMQAALDARASGATNYNEQSAFTVQRNLVNSYQPQFSSRGSTGIDVFPRIAVAPAGDPQGVSLSLKR